MCNPLDLEPLRSWPIMFKNLPQDLHNIIQIHNNV